MIYHITTKKVWNSQKNKKEYSHTSLKKEGFIHCALQHQLKRVLDKYYSNMKNVIILHIDEKRLRSKLVYEDLSKLNEKHPHIYGPINKDCILKIENYK